MMEMFVFFSFSVLFHYTIVYSHPLVLGMSLLFFSVIVGMIIWFYGPTFSFCVFMVTIAGVLVVFSYTISLVPFKGLNSYNKKKNVKENKMDKNSELVFGEKVYNNNKKYFALSLSFLMGLMGMFKYKIFEMEDISSMMLSYSQIAYFTDDYAFVVVWLGILLFFSMVFGMSVANRYEGALIQ